MKFIREYKIETGIWEDTILVVFTDHLQTAITNLYKKYNIKDVPAHDFEYMEAAFIPVRDVKGAVEGWMFFNINALTPAIIAHECFHATSDILRHRQIILSEATEEAYTYTQQYLITEVLKHYAKAKKKYRK